MDKPASGYDTGEASFGAHVADAVQVVADDVHRVVIADTGHFVAEEMMSVLTAFLAPRWPRRTRRPSAAAAAGSLG